MQYLKWIPSYEGNREKPLSERITIEICPLTYGEISDVNARVIRTKPEGSEEFIDNRNEIVLETVRKHVGKIHNLVDLYGDNISSGTDLVEIRGDWVLIQETEAALINVSKLKAGLEKNLSPPSDGSQGKSRSGGIVSPVKNTG